MWHSYTRHNVQKPRLSITKLHDEGTFVLLSLQTLQLQLYTGAVTGLMEWYRDNLWAKDRLGAINLPVRICLHHTPINKRKGYLASTFRIIRIKHNPTILALELLKWKKLHKMVTSHTDQYTKNYHASTFMSLRIKHNPTILALELSKWKELRKMVTSHTDQYTKRLICINLHDHTYQA